jgi:hypothetical protein
LFLRPNRPEAINKSLPDVGILGPHRVAQVHFNRPARDKSQGSLEVRKQRCKPADARDCAKGLLAYRHPETLNPFDGNVIDFAKQSFERESRNPKRWNRFEPDNTFGFRIPPNERTFNRPWVNA